MRRLTTSRAARLTLAAALATAVALVAALLAARRRPRDTITQPPPAIPITRATLGPEPSVERPAPVPILGTPTAADLKRFTPKPSVLDRPPAAPRHPREPLTRATRRRLTRWAVFAGTLLLLALSTQALENTVFDRGPSTEYVDEVVISIPDGSPLPGADSREDKWIFLDVGP
ncbi:hypothetical protein AB0C27_08180 [Nonomuraea sp. NPDC048882]|uniref:hypothetical protein n=1 Tax=Nonomuraea sp. NPDC048882 TaxID=3154347 RepID=UPI0033ECA2DB